MTHTKIWEAVFGVGVIKQIIPDSVCHMDDGQGKDRGSQTDPEERGCISCVLWFVQRNSVAHHSVLVLHCLLWHFQKINKHTHTNICYKKMEISLQLKGEKFEELSRGGFTL